MAFGEHKTNIVFSEYFPLSEMVLFCTQEFVICLFSCITWNTFQGLYLKFNYTQQLDNNYTCLTVLLIYLQCNLAR